MKLRTQFIIGIAIFLAVFLVIGTFVVINASQATFMNDQRDIANQVVTDGLELEGISGDYLLNYGERQRGQWNATYDRMESHLAELQPQNPEQQALVTNMQENLVNLKSVFEEIAPPAAGNATSPRPNPAGENLRTSWSRITVADQRIVSDATHLSNLIKTDLDTVRNQRSVILVVLLGFVLAVFAVIFLVMYRQIIRSVSMLENGMRVIGSGNLDYRLEERGKDEFRYLAESFNTMTESRRNAEKDLRASHEELVGAYELLRSADQELRTNYEKLKANEKARAESEARFRLLYNNSVDAILITRPDGQILSANPAACALFGRSEEEILHLGRDAIVDVTDPRFAEAVKIRAETGQFKGELAMLRRDGSRFTGEIASSIFISSNGELQTSIIIRDITDRTLMESEIRSLNRVLEQRVAERTEQLNRSLQEKEVLLKEIHHRVKNNLQIVASLFSLQSRYIKDESVLAALRESQNRVRAMALVHEKLYRSGDLAHIDLTEYVRFLVENLFNFYHVNQSRIRFSVNLEEVAVDIHSAIPIGLIVNELVSNSLKHAFPPGAKGEIAISGKKEGNRIELIVSDTGAGIPKGFDWRNAESLGLRLVIILTDQMNGTIELDPARPGTKFHITLHEKS